MLFIYVELLMLFIYVELLIKLLKRELAVSAWPNSLYSELSLSFLPTV